MSTASRAEAAPTTGAALAIRDLHSGYGQTRVLHGVSLDVPQSAVVALLGANGAGKTTLLKTVCGLISPTAGHVSLSGDDITNKSAHARSRLGLCYIPEGRGIFRSLTVRENLVMQSEPGEQDRAIEVAVEAFPVLGQRLSQNAGTMSGGEQQMLALAQAYVRDPRLILVDEASLGLAPLIVDAVFEFLQRVNARGASLLIVDQFVTRALQMAETAYVLRRGEIVYSGSSAELLDSDLFSTYLGTEPA
ncbi:MAG: branched-chain amino acid transporter ATPase [Acidimicrobiia bacterium]|nr:branched-chain amino acid transporter ATPase [Acidimicrobiia bacterium]